MSFSYKTGNLKVSLLKINKITSIIRCPLCESSSFHISSTGATCTRCEQMYLLREGKPFLLLPNSQAQIDYEQLVETPQTYKDVMRRIFKMPEERIWSGLAASTIFHLLNKANPDDANSIVVNIGAGIESIFRKAFGEYEDVLRIGLPHSGTVDIFGDAMNLPIVSNSVDLLITSSVIEHLSNPEIAVHEIYRILKPGGKVYAEIPFIAAFHMEPWDFQRYTIAGIEQLFARHHFEMEKKGISSGPFNAWALLTRDFFWAITPGAIPKFGSRFIFSWLLHPIKYLDSLVGDSKWAQKLACNFFYVGIKPE